MKEITIIAEAGVNHNGSFALAIQLIDAAAESGAQIVKFQYFTPSKLVIPKAKKANYQIENTMQGAEESQTDMLSKLCLSFEEHVQLYEYCKSKDIEYMCSPFSEADLDLIEPLISKIKIASGEATNNLLLEHACTFGKPIILSTGMCTLQEVIEAVQVIKQKCQADALPFPSIEILHCNTAYPTPIKDINLKAMLSLEKTLPLIFPDLELYFGYSDHSLGIEVPIAAAALGATVIEKHFTLSRDMDGPDHRASLEPSELKEMVRCIKNVSRALGTGIKKPQPSEIENIPIARKSWYYSSSLSKGKKITKDDIKLLRPGNGMAPSQFVHILGRELGKDVLENDKVELDHFS